MLSLKFFLRTAARTLSSSTRPVVEVEVVLPDGGGWVWFDDAPNNGAAFVERGG